LKKALLIANFIVGDLNKGLIKIDLKDCIIEGFKYLVAIRIEIFKKKAIVGKWFNID
jgi:hypothetical protein